MLTLLFTFVIFALSLVGLGLGVLAGRRPLTGSCGGLGCSHCGACHATHEKEPAT